MFRAWRYDVKHILRAGPNTLRVVFPSPLNEANRIASQDSWRSTTLAPTPVKTYLRKAAYEYGWDWGPRFVTSGIWRDVRLETWNDARIADLFLSQGDIRPELARVVAEVVAESQEEASVSIQYSVTGGPRTLVQKVMLAPDVNHISVPVEIERPELWYPAGYGKQPLYRFQVGLSINGNERDTGSTRAGLRTVALSRDPDRWGRSFGFVVKGIPIFAKGASVIPFDSFPWRVTPSAYRRILEAAKDTNMNMMRQWGGGVYNSYTFYDLCDELGIMVWQDFMFGNEWQPGTFDFRQNVIAEVTYQLQRLRNHPSTVLWCGRNETEVSRGWGRTVAMTRNDPEIARHMWQSYLVLFKGDIAQMVKNYDPATPNWLSSPSADYEETSGNFLMPGEKNLQEPQTYMFGDIHNYGVHSPEDYERYHPRFMSEYGWFALPNMQTIRTYTNLSDQTSILTSAMLAHQDGEDGNKRILEEVQKRYGVARDLSSLVYLSQVLQAEWVRMGAEHLRRSKPEAMGSLFWQLNDCWPTASFAGDDYFGHWKALQYAARRFYSPLLVSPHVEDGVLKVYVVSDRPEETHATIRLRILKPTGELLSEIRKKVTLPVSLAESA